MSRLPDANHFGRRLPSIKAAYLGAAILAACLVSACGGDDGPAATTSSAAAPAPLPPQTTSATTPASPSLPQLAADQPYVDNTAYDTTATGSLPSATEAAAVTHHRITLNGKPLTYTATAGHLTVRDPNTNAPTASLFYTAYTLDGADVTKRPVTFFFNGGPGSSSNFLHMGSYAPMRVFSAQGSTVSGPNDVTLGENPQTLLDKTDIVFVDPPGTGYSEAIAPKQNKDFWGVDADELVNAGLIYRYLNINNRGQSPLMIYGESYGGPRVGIMSYTLHDTYGIKLSGLLMQAPALNFYENASSNRYPDGSVHPARRYPLPAFTIPTITMAAKYWGAISDPSLVNLSLTDLFQKSEDFVFSDLKKLANPIGSDGSIDTSWQSSAAAMTQSQASVQPLNALLGNGVYASANNSYLFNQAATGSPSSSADQSITLRMANAMVSQVGAQSFYVTNFGFVASVDAMVNGKTLGLYDLRKALTGTTIPASISNYLTYDPSLDDLSAYTPIFTSYAYNTLKYQAVSGYQGLNSAISSAWNKLTSYPDGSRLPFPDATIFIADEMAINPKMQVLTAAGYYDGVVPAAAIDWDMQYISDPNGGQIPQSQMQSNYTRVLYPGGHMAYADDASRQQMHDTLVGFYAKATTSSIPSMSR
ncbi:S10 family serine carboxypeptidase-like protein [Burkholderia lata]|uniref:Peptidase S10, serine carboxypeptidase n=1 Tax=Burkholderia lata (strain ATCC 17760 / DSM 23089 / LMG 22485 / NCIMB 9086 / R18194 / 383) TaxID=482957 RepID=A0A6P2GLG5_BURL3|nr:hypothetical protein [Burkholderia lata]VWB04887.1 peptidase S10, serine carboxypeptidase [Burkholderia lata]